MKVEKKDLEKSQVELNVELSLEEFKPYIEKGAIKVSKDVKIDGFRQGKVPYEMLKQKIGEMTILEEAARMAINDTLNEAIKEKVKAQPVGNPKVDITKLAPDNPLGYKVVLALLPKVELKSYKDLKIKKRTVEIKEKDVETMINNLQEMRAQEVTVDREIKMDDKVIVDIQMFLDKVPVESGQSKDTAAIIGKDYIVPGFDKKLIGAKKNDVREFSLPYPKDFHMQNLAGKMVEFKVTIKDVFNREVPALDDKFALGFGVKKIAELRDNIKKSIVDEKTREAKQANEQEMLEKLIEKNSFGDIPEMLVEHETHTMLHELEHSVTERGGKFEEYLQSINKTRDQLTLDLLPDAVKRVKTSLLNRAVAKAEKISAKESEIDEHIKAMEKQYSQNKAPDSKEILERLKTPEYRAYVNNIFTSKKVIDKLAEWNIE